MRRTCLVIVLAVAWMEISSATVSAQLWPGPRSYRGSYDSYDDDAVAAGVALGSADNAARSNAQAYQAWSSRASSPQMSGMESGIRNTLDANAQQRTQEIYGRQQAGRDWWFQVQQQQVAQQQVAQQQMAQRQMTPQYTAMSAGFESAPAASSPKVDTDIIRWPPLLQAPQFAAQRAQIEAPYRRSSKGLSRPTTEDYQDMIKTAEQMKLILKSMTADITAQEYFGNEAFLDQLAAEARGRLEQAAPKK